MSYAQKKVLSGNPAVSIVLTILVVGSLLYTIVTGLAYNVINKAAEDLQTFDVEEEPPPPVEPPPPPPDQPQTPPPVVAPPPIIRTNVMPPPVIQNVPVAPPPQITPQAPPAPPPPPPAKVVKAQSARGNLQALFSPDDYPQDAVRNEETGTVTVSLTIGTNGRVTGCSVTGSSGSSSLDRATCRVLQSRARFTPALLSNGQPTTDTYTQRITWRLQ